MVWAPLHLGLILHLDLQFYDLNNSFMLAPKIDLGDLSTDLVHAEWGPVRPKGHGRAPGADGGGTKSPRGLGAENLIMRYFYR